MSCLARFTSALLTDNDNINKPACSPLMRICTNKIVTRNEKMEIINNTIRLNYNNYNTVIIKRTIEYTTYTKTQKLNHAAWLRFCVLVYIV